MWIPRKKTVVENCSMVTPLFQFHHSCWLWMWSLHYQVVPFLLHIIFTPRITAGTGPWPDPDVSDPGDPTRPLNSLWSTNTLKVW